MSELYARAPARIIRARRANAETPCRASWVEPGPGRRREQVFDLLRAPPGARSTSNFELLEQAPVRADAMEAAMLSYAGTSGVARSDESGCRHRKVIGQ